MSIPDPTSNAPPRKRQRLKLGIEPTQARVEIPTWIERFRRSLKTIGVGVSISITAHAIVLTILAFIYFTVRSTSDEDSLAISWQAQGDRTVLPGKKMEPIAIPIDLGGGAPAPKATQQEPSTTGGAASGPGGVGVSPVDGRGRGTLGGRNPRTRAANLEGMGGSKPAENAIKSGLQWLSRQQKSDGHWELHQGYPDAGFATIRTDTGATALALLAFLGHGNTHQSGDFANVVAKGLKWLREIQDPQTGDLHDLRQEEGRNGAFYAHAMGTIALCEAMAMTNDTELQPTAERAVKYLLSSQHPVNGGWKYRPISKLMVGDLSVTGWALMALHTARMAGIEIPHEEFVRASTFLDSVKVQGLSRYKYEPTTPDGKESPALTAEALLCRQWLGWPKTFPEMVQGVKYVTAEEQLPDWSGGRRNVYAWYYTSQMLHNIGGEEWKRWNKAVRDVTVKNQVTSGSAKPGSDTRGSWNPMSPPGDPFEHSEKGGRLYMTALCILILETPYRHQPIYADDDVASSTTPKSE